MGKFRDLTGQRFGRLTVVERSGSDKQKHATWKCQCDCGEVRIVGSGDLHSGNTKSCGCLRTDKLVSYNTKHGKAGTRLYMVWQDMNQRCSNPLNPKYYRYGERGIIVCDEWRDDFQAFYEWAIANGYDETAPVGECTIDRIDNDKGYSPDNCRWADQKTQQNNRSNNRKDNKNERN